MAMTDAAHTQLVDLLEQVWRAMADLCASLDEPAWQAPTECPGWTVQDTLVHITAVERHLMDDPLPAADIPDLPHVKNSFGRWNERWIESRRASPGSVVLEEFEATTASRLAELRALDDDGFAAVSWTPLGEGTVAGLLGLRILDSWVHEQDMRRAVDRPGDLDSPAAAHSIDSLLLLLPYIVGKKTGAPDGSTVVLTLTGPLRRTIAVAMAAGRGDFIDPPPETPGALLAMSSETYERLACGRVDPEQAVVTGAVTIEGDVDLGAAVVRELNQMF
jgi:uncharacterized protein (TIGR03083 family)